MDLQQSFAPLWILEWQGQWEGRRLWSLLRERALPLLSRDGQPLQFHALISEPAAVREALVAEMALELNEEGIIHEIRVGAAYRQGYHWVTEEVLPALRARPGVARVQLACRPFPTAGAPPEALVTVGEGAGPNRESPAHWLQELQPAEQVLARELGLPAGAVTLELTPDLATTYRVRACAEEGTVLYSSDFTAACARHPYLAQDPAAGWVHPATGRLRVRQGTLALEWRIATDLEQFWEFYRQEVLPRLVQARCAAANRQPDGGAGLSPGTLQVEVWASEPGGVDVPAEPGNTLEDLGAELMAYTGAVLSDPGPEVSVEPHAYRADGNPVGRVRLFPRR